MTNSIASIYDIDPAFGETTLTFIWTCPRCGHRNYAKVSGEDFLHGADFECENTAVCGSRKVLFSILLDIIGHYKTPGDAPLLGN